jgi:hypothetical protein
MSFIHKKLEAESPRALFLYNTKLLIFMALAAGLGVLFGSSTAG